MKTILYLLIGTYTMGLSDGIYVYKFNTLTGESEYISMVAVENPSYLDLSKDGKYIYAVTENDGNPSYANAISFDEATGQMVLLNSQETFASSPCNIATDSKASHVITANYGGGSITVFKTDSAKLLPASQVIMFEGNGTDTVRQRTPHLHCVMFSPDEKYLFAADLGTDNIHRFEVNHTGSGDFLKEESLTSFKVADSSGPRHFVFHPSNKFMYLINELAGTVTGFHYDKGNLKEFQTIQADTLNAQGSGDIGVTPNGKFLYASNRLKGDGIAIFSINETDGKLTKVGYQETGIHPRNFVITPNGKYLLAASRDSNLIEVFEIDENTGLLTNIQKDITDIDMPVCLKFI